MKTKTTVFCTLTLTFLIFQATCWSQVQPSYAQPNGAYGAGSFDQVGQYPAGYPGSGIAQASYCAEPSCGIGNVCDSAGCSGACGGQCDGGCGVRTGVLGRLLGGAAGGLGGGLGAGGVSGGWLDVEYLLWWNKPRFLPALVTTSPAGTPDTVAGHLGQPTTSILFGNDEIGGGPYSGVRVSGGKWLDPGQTLGMGGRFFTVGGEDDFSQSSDDAGNPILARPFFNITNNPAAQDSLLVAYPGVTHGSVNMTAENRARGFDLYIRKLLLSGYCNRLDIIGGYHNSCVEDSVTALTSSISDDGTRIPLGAQIDTRDYFEVKNQFNGGFIGLMGSAEDGRLSWNFLAKVALGNMNQEATINGSSTSSIPGAGSATDNFGLLALPSNIGSFDRDEFAVVPELNVNVAYNVSNNFSLLLGYTFIYWSEVGLAGDLIDTTTNFSQLTVGGLNGEARPSSDFKSDGFWYTGLSVGGSLRF